MTAFFDTSDVCYYSVESLREPEECTVQEELDACARVRAMDADVNMKAMVRYNMCFEFPDPETITDEMIEYSKDYRDRYIKAGWSDQYIQKIQYFIDTITALKQKHDEYLKNLPQMLKELEATRLKLSGRDKEMEENGYVRYDEDTKYKCSYLFQKGDKKGTVCSRSIRPKKENLRVTGGTKWVHRDHICRCSAHRKTIK
jgi:hypothetical protein